MPAKCEIELDEAYFGSVRKGQRILGARVKSIVFSIQPARAGWKGVRQGGGIDFGRDADYPYPGAYPQGLGVLHRCVSGLPVVAAL